LFRRKKTIKANYALMVSESLLAYFFKMLLTVLCGIRYGGQNLDGSSAAIWPVSKTRLLSCEVFFLFLEITRVFEKPV